jgi:hypothetical protein
MDGSIRLVGGAHPLEWMDLLLVLLLLSEAGKEVLPPVVLVAV